MIYDLRFTIYEPNAGRKRFTVLLFFSFFVLHSALGFEGRIAATLTRGGEGQKLLYTVGTNFLRIEQLDTNWPHARDIVNLQTGEITLLFPHNRSFVRLPGSAGAAPVQPGGGGSGQPGSPPFTPPPMQQMPPGVGPQPGSFGAPPVAMPMMPVPPMEKMELVQTNGTTNILGFTCARYELRQRGEVMEIWATEQLLPFRPYLENQPHRFGPRMIEEQWGALVAEKKLFPLRALLSFENGPERMRFEVTAITPEKLKSEDMKLFEPPPEYREIQPLPF